MFRHLCGPKIFHTGISWLEARNFPPQVKVQQLSSSQINNNPSSMPDFCPIFLCNVFYKIISKVLVNRLKPILPKCIFQEQSTSAHYFHH